MTYRMSLTNTIIATLCFGGGVYVLWFCFVFLHGAEFSNGNIFFMAKIGAPFMGASMISVGILHFHARLLEAVPLYKKYVGDPVDNWCLRRFYYLMGTALVFWLIVKWLWSWTVYGISWFHQSAKSEGASMQAADQAKRST